MTSIEQARETLSRLLFGDERVDAALALLRDLQAQRTAAQRTMNEAQERVQRAMDRGNSVPSLRDVAKAKTAAAEAADQLQRVAMLFEHARIVADQLQLPLTDLLVTGALDVGAPKDPP